MQNCQFVLGKQKSLQNYEQQIKIIGICYARVQPMLVNKYFAIPLRRTLNIIGFSMATTLEVPAGTVQTDYQGML